MNGTPTGLRARLSAQLHATAGGLPAAYWYLWAGTLVNRLGGFVVPFLTFYLTRECGLSVAQAGLVASLHGVGAVAAGLVGGALADRLGRRTTLVGGLWSGAAGMVLLGFSRTPAEIAVAALVAGFLGELYRPVVSAAVSDLVPASERTRAFGLLYWAVNVGFAIGVPLAGLVARSGFRILFLADALTTFLYGLIVWWKVPETRVSRPAPGVRLSSAVPFRDPVFLAFSLPVLVLAIIFYQGQATLSLDLTARGMSTAAFGGVLAVNGLLIMLVQPFASRVVGRLRRSSALAGAAVLTGIGFGLHAVTEGALLAALAVGIWTLGEIVQAPVKPSVVSDLAPPELRGSYQGAFHMLGGLAAFVAPALGGWVLQHFGSRVLWGGCLLLGLAAAGWHLLIAGARRRRLEELHAETPGLAARLD
ncbi:MDR family MFS transporter [Corallococcus sicarius]|uniref:MFS transporter n=1 Tax=Corallococcus sicarius TaxID=2316726 RepID=A0A3A8MJ71_9BACT|nr:MFS transporter [Corallococcus sicarius]RKH32166.1 MFS transporter [Corallococcus sicarius]